MAAKGPPVLLIHPPSNRERPQGTPRLPTNLTSLAAHLISHGIDTEILDLVTHVDDWDTVRHRIREALSLRPLLIGLAVSLTDFRYEAMEVARLIKDSAPYAFLVIGGQHATALPAQMITHFRADAVVMGEGEETLLHLVRAFKRGSSLEEVPGLCLPHNGRQIFTGPRRKIGGLSGMTVPAHSILPGFEGYLHMSLEDPFSLWEGFRSFNGETRMMQVLGSRGCPNACSFCSSSAFWGRGVRVRPVGHMVAEMEFWHKEYGVDFFRIDDDTLTISESRTLHFCEMLQSADLRVQWEAQTRIDTVTEPMMRAVSESGCVAMGFGIESGSETMRRVLRKGLKIDQEEMVDRLLMARESGVPMAIYLLVGTPGENEETVHDSVALVKRVRPHYVSPVRLEIRPGTPLYEYARACYGLDDSVWLNGPTIVHNTFEKEDRVLRGFMFDIRKAWIDTMDMEFRNRVMPMIHALEAYYGVDFGHSSPPQNADTSARCHPCAVS